MKKTDWQFLVNALMFTCVSAVIMIGIIMGLSLDQGPSGQGAAKYFLGLHRHQWGDLHFVLSIVFCALLILHLALDWNWIKAKAKQVFKSAWVAGLALIFALPFGVLAVGWSLAEKNDQSYSSYGLGSETQDGHGRDREKTPQAAAQSGDLPEETSAIENGGQGGRDMAEKSPTLDASAAPENRASHPQGERRKLVAGRRSDHASAVTVTGQMTLLEVEHKTGIPASDIADHLNLPPSTPYDMSLGRLRRIYGFSIEDVRGYIERRLQGD